MVKGTCMYDTDAEHEMSKSRFKATSNYCTKLSNISKLQTDGILRQKFKRCLSSLTEMRVFVWFSTFVTKFISFLLEFAL